MFRQPPRPTRTDTLFPDTTLFRSALYPSCAAILRTPLFGLTRFPMHPIRIVLVGPQHPGNIGSAARAMKTMGLDQLRLVAPERYPHVDATTMAVGAGDEIGRASCRERVCQYV